MYIFHVYTAGVLNSPFNKGGIYSTSGIITG